MCVGGVSMIFVIISVFAVGMAQQKKSSQQIYFCIVLLYFTCCNVFALLKM